jgi:hypothetical protein
VHTPDDFIRQFILAQSRVPVSETWQIRRNGSWILAAQESLPIIDIFTKSSEPIGWLLGFPINKNIGLVKKSVVLNIEVNSSSVACQFENFLYQFCGHYIAVCLMPDFNTSRVYLDAGGIFPAVYSQAQRIVASSIGLIPQQSDNDDNQELRRAMDIPRQDHWYPFGLTPRRSCCRLLPNHYLDLEVWEVKRHWPSENDLNACSSVQSVVEEIAVNLRLQIESLAREFSLYLSLTAGRDSRTLLAAARGVLDRIQTYTFRSPWNQLDSEVARRIAKRHHFDHVIFDYQQPSQVELNGWLERTGYCVAGAVLRNVRTVKQLEDNRPRIGGIGGEVGRQYYVRPGDTRTTPLTPSEVLERLHLPVHSATLERARLWLDGLPSTDFYSIIDLLYIEQRLGCWGGPQSIGATSSYVFNPFCTRRIFTLMLSLLPEYKRQAKVSDDLVKYLWPELLKFPINRYTGMRHWIKKTRRRLTRMYA